MKPIIGVYDDIVENNGIKDRRRGVKLICFYLDLCGAVPALIPHLDDYKTVCDNISGVVFPGGGDVDPKYYRSDKHDKTKIDGEEKESARFYQEDFITRSMIEQNKPIIGICRGMQVLNVILGNIYIENNPNYTNNIGKLIQHLPDVFPDDDVHLDPKAFLLSPEKVVKWRLSNNYNPKHRHYLKPSHDILVLNSSFMGDCLNIGNKNKAFGCYSIHHQGVGADMLAPQLRPCAYSVKPDGSINYGLVEAAEADNILVIQSHIEAGLDGIVDKIFTDFIKKSKASETVNYKAMQDYISEADKLIKSIKSN